MEFNYHQQVNSKGQYSKTYTIAVPDEPPTYEECCGPHRTNFYLQDNRRDFNWKHEHIFVLFDYEGSNTENRLSSSCGKEEETKQVVSFDSLDGHTIVSDSGASDDLTSTAELRTLVNTFLYVLLSLLLLVCISLVFMRLFNLI